MQTREGQVDVGGGGWRDAATSQGMMGATRRWAGQEGSCPRASGGSGVQCLALF